MATSDLLAELSKDLFRAAPDVEKKVVAVVLRQLDDQSGDVSTLAVKCLPPLVRGCGEPSVVDVVHGLVERLCAEEGKDARSRRDAARHRPQDGARRDSRRARKRRRRRQDAGAETRRRARGVAAPGSAAKNTGAAGDVAGDCLDVLHAAAAGLGAYMTSSAADGVSPETARELEAALVKYLAESGRPGTRKKAATCLASLGATAGDGFLARCASAARREIAEAATRQAAERDALAAPYAQLLGAIAHAAGSRFGAHAFDQSALRRLAFSGGEGGRRRVYARDVPPHAGAVRGGVPARDGGGAARGGRREPAARVARPFVRRGGGRRRPRGFGRGEAHGRGRAHGR